MIFGAARRVARSLAVARGRVFGLLVALCGFLGLWGVAFAGSASAACQTGTVTFASTGAEQCYTVPTGVSSVQIAAVGAPGGNGFDGGRGFGAAVGAVVSVSPGETVYVEVGGAGVNGFPGGAGGGGFNGGGTAGSLPLPGSNGAGGGGASDVRSVSNSIGGQVSLGSRLLVAGGGGGASVDGVGGNADGPGGGLVAGIGGGAGGIGGGGAGGNVPACNPAASIGSPGTFGQGGAGGSNFGAGDSSGGGAGGGYYGGGGGQGGTPDAGCNDGGGGGGGGSYVTPSGSAVTYATDSTGVPSVTITPQTPATPPQGPPGPQGQPGPTGATGQTGATGPSGQIELVVCNTITRTTTQNGHKHTTKVQKCSTRLVSGTVKFTIESDDLGATLTRAHRVYATGVAVPTAAGRWQLVLTHDTRRLHSGRYTLTLRTLHGRGRIVEHTTITIT